MTKYLNDSIALLHFFMRCMLAATAAELFKFQTVLCRFAVLGLRIVPLFAITTLQRNDLSGHCSLPNPTLEFVCVVTGPSPVTTHTT